LVVYLSLTPAICSAQQVYQITETELERLDRNFSELKSINDRQSSESVRLQEQLQESQAQLNLAEKQSQTLKEQLGSLKVTLEGQEQSLQNANRLLQEYEREARSKLRRSRNQRNIAFVIAVAAIYFAVRKM
jgi:hypothetical protein